MYNFAIPSTPRPGLLRAGVTSSTPKPVPKATGKRAYVLTARGGAASAADHQEPYLRQVMGFIGIHDVTFIHAEGMNLGGDFRKRLEPGERQACQVA
jgi:FMN-dependent NADH-azoreductase